MKKNLTNFKTKMATDSYTSLPETPEGRRKKAESYLNLFAKYTPYRHGKLNPYLNWLKSKTQLEKEAVYKFFNIWYPVSRHQPQMLWRIAAAYTDWHDRHLILLNAIEEDGHLNPGDNPHYDLLGELIFKLGGKLDVDPEAEALVNKFHKTLDSMTPAQATGYLAAIEHPALDISNYFIIITTICGFPELLNQDKYLSIHVDVEPKHLIWSHGNALDWMGDEVKKKHLEYRKEDITNAFTHAMSFWDQFWALAFSKLGYKN